jgi:putative ABC transport system permease protein
LIDDLQGYSLADVNVSFEHDYRYEQVAPIALGNADVSSAEGWLTYPGTLITNRDDTGTDFSFVALPADSDLIAPIIAAGRWLVPGDENAVVISNHFLNKFPETKIGDWLTIKIDDKETKWQVVGMYTIALDNSTLYVSYDYFTRIVGQPNQVKSLQVLTNQHDPATQSRIANELRTVYEAQGIKVTSAMTATESWIAARSIFNVVVAFMSVMAVMIAVVGGLGLMGTMSISVLERTREIGVLRAIGAGNGDIQSIVIVEGMIIGLMSWAISVLVAVPITSLLSYGVGVSILKVPLSPVYSMAGIVAWLVFTLVLAAIASAFPARGASRLTVKDTLAYE